MAQRGVLPPLRVTVPALGMAPSQRLNKYHLAFSPSTTPTPVIHQRPNTRRLWIAILLQLSSLYAAHQWLGQSPEQSVVKFAFLAFFGASVVLGFVQRPWEGRMISSNQWLLLLASGALMALSFILRMRGLAVVGPLETILAEYAGAVVGKVLMKAQRKVHGVGDAKVRGAISLVAGLFLLSQGWAVSNCSPLSTFFVPVMRTSTFVTARLTRSARIGSASGYRFVTGEETLELKKDCAKYVWIIAPFVGGLLSCAQRLLPSKTSLGSIPKKRLQALTYVTAAMVFIPVALYQLAVEEVGGLDQSVLLPLLSMIVFGMVVAFYGDFFSEEKLLITPLSPYHYLITICSVCLLELAYGSNFSLVGFVVCCGILAIGVRAGAFISGGLDWNSLSEREYSGASFITLVRTPIYHIWTDVKTRKIAMFLLINTSFMVVEFVFGFLSNSLGLISDACHMLFDCAALAVGLYASYISRLPANSKFQFGYGRFEVLAGYANAVFLILVASLIVLESLERLLEPPEISTGSLLVVSVGGLLVNIVGLIFFHEAHHHAHGSGPCTHVHQHQGPHTPEEEKHGSSGVHTHAGHYPASHNHNQHRHDSLDNPGVLKTQVQKEQSTQQHFQSGRKDDPTGSLYVKRHATEGVNYVHDHSISCSHDHHYDSVSSISHEQEVQQSHSHSSHQHHAGCSHGDDHHHQHPSSQPHSHGHSHSREGPCDHYQHSHTHCGEHSHNKSNHGQSHLLSHDRHVGMYSSDHHEHGQQPAFTHIGGDQGSGMLKHNLENHDHMHETKGDALLYPLLAGNSEKSHEDCGQGCSHGHDHMLQAQHKCSENGHNHEHVHDQSNYLHGHDHDHDDHGDHHHIDHNMEGIFLHILADTLGSVGVVISTLLIKYKGWLFTDPACSIFISVLIVSSVLPLVRNSAELLLQRVPRSAEKRIQKALKKVEEVEGVHDWHKLHVWSYTNTELVGSLRLHASLGTDKQLVRSKVSHILKSTGVVDLTLEVEELEHD